MSEDIEIKYLPMTQALGRRDNKPDLLTVARRMRERGFKISAMCEVHPRPNEQGILALFELRDDVMELDPELDTDTEERTATETTPQSPTETAKPTVELAESRTEQTSPRLGTPEIVGSSATSTTAAQ